MTALRLWQVIFSLFLIGGAVNFFLDKKESLTPHAYPIAHWEDVLDQQASNLLGRTGSGEMEEISPDLPQIILRDSLAIYWTTAFADTIVLNASSGQGFICPDGDLWTALRQQIDQRHEWIGLVPVSMIIASQESNDHMGDVGYLGSCHFETFLPAPGSQKQYQWWWLAAILIAPWYFFLKFQGAGIGRTIILLSGTAFYYSILTWGLRNLSNFLYPFLDPLVMPYEANAEVPVILFRAFFLFYLGWSFYQHSAWSRQDGLKNNDKKTLLLCYSVILISIMAGSQLLAGITVKNWLDIHFLYQNFLDHRVVSGTVAWIFGMGGVVLIALRLTRFIHQGTFRTMDRLSYMGISTLIILPMTWLPQISISWAGLLFAGLATMLFLDLFVEEEKPSLSWILAAFLLISTLTTTLAYQQLMENERSWTRMELEEWHQENSLTPASIRIGLNNWSQKDLQFYQIHFEDDKQHWTMDDQNTMVTGSQNAGREQLRSPVRSFTAVHPNPWSLERVQLNLLQAMALFSKIFAFLIGLFTLLTIINYRWPILPERFGLALFAQQSLRTRIQIGILATILMSFLIIGAITQYYYSQNDHTVELRSMDRQISRLTSLAHYMIDSIPASQIPDRISQLENTFQAEIVWHQADDPPALKMAIPMEILNRWNTGLPFTVKMAQDNETLVFTSREPEHLLTIRWGRDQVLTPFASNMMSTLMSVYVFLFLLAGSIGLAIANSITWPIEILAEKIRQVRLGKQNEPLEWDNPDELGDLIRVYNEMIDKLDQSARTMVRLERDMAWREMAQQVAHEIKNPLTPMKLSIQYLMQSVGSDPERLRQLVPRVSETLLEQVDNLSTIATEFSNFGTLPKANNAKVNLNEVVASVHDLFRKRDDLDINLYVPIDDLWVFADRNYMIRILNNLVKNAIQAIPADRNGKIDIILKKLHDNAQIIIRDNGIGIPDDMKEKVFQPNFTTKSSGTGLGLAICASLLESFNGIIYFETVPGEGTEFFVELPLMLVENNFKHIPRVDLDE